jgi:hypothetical protein
MTRWPSRISSDAIRFESRYGLGEQPTTAHVRGSDRHQRIASSIDPFIPGAP